MHVNEICECYMWKIFSQNSFQLASWTRFRVEMHTSKEKQFFNTEQSLGLW